MKPSTLPTEEASAWSSIKGKWLQIYGSFPGKGLSIEWHDFSNETTLDWGQSFHDRSLEICLNFSGEGFLKQGKTHRSLEPQQVAVYTTTKSRLKAIRNSGHFHRFITLELSPEYLLGQFASTMDGLRHELGQFIENPEKARPFLEVQPMRSPLLSVRQQLLEPGIHASARDIWYQSKVLEILAQLLFKADKPSELFCQRHKRVTKERVERATHLLQRDLTNPPSLDMLAQEVGCSPFHLSRIFSQQTGMSIPRYLRMIRIEKAAELLRAGAYNVTHAAFEVGYTSLSAFNQAFVEIMGCCPGLYPHAKNLFKTKLPG